MRSLLDYLVELAIRLGNWGYLIFFIGPMAESAAFLGLLVPGETLALVAGFLCAQGLFDLDVLIGIVAAGAALGDNIGYELGRRLGRPWALRHGGRFGLTEERLRRAETFFSRHGGKAVFLARFVHFARVLAPFVAGSSRMRYLTFLFYNLLGAAIWASAIVLVGYFAGQTAERWAGRASAVVGGIVLTALALALAWRWMAGHEAQVTALWNRCRRHPRVVALVMRVAPQIAWLRRRLSPGSYFGLQLTLGTVLMVAAAWLFGGIAQDVVAGDPLTNVDKKIAWWFYTHQNGRVTAFMSGISSLHTWPIAVAAFLFLLYLARQRQWRWVAILICSVLGGMLLNSAMKLAFHRARPSFSDFSTTLSSFGFPSGHTVAATLIYGVIATYVISRARSWKWRTLTPLTAFFAVVLVALSRLYLGAHYLSDVLAAMAEGVAWLALCHIAVTTTWGRTSRSPAGHL